MKNIFLEAFIISFIYVIYIFLEMRYNKNEEKSLKDIVKEGLLVYIAVVSGIFIIDQFKPEVEKLVSESPPLVFVDNPPF
jgi:surface polysaccharide O-acyltransferase-like enzyme